MNRFEVFRRWSWSVLVVIALAFAIGGCDGKDGRDGLDGQDGRDGIDGQDGPPGPGAAVIPLESCGVCHDDGSFASAPDFHALAPIEMVSNVTFAVNGADLDVTFDLAADGVAAMNYDSMQRGYRTDGTTRTNICGNASRSDPCDPALLTLTNNGGGNYTVKVLGGAAAAATDSRYLFRVGAGDDSDTRVYFYGDFPASPIATPAVSAEACTNCHGPEGIDVHGGYFAAVDGAEPCLTCHGVDVIGLGSAAHRYHSSIWEDDPVNNPGEFTEVTYPTYMTNCGVCHSQAAELTAANSMAVSGANCFTCHYSMDGWDFVGPDGADLSFHRTIMDPETADCSVCHDGTTAPATVTGFHNGLTTGRGGVIWDGVDTSVVEGKKFTWAITSMADDGANLTFTWEASYNGVPVDPCNDTVGLDAPTFHLGNGSLRTYRSYAQGDDFIMGTSSSPGQPGRANPDATNTTCSGLIATTVIPVENVAADKGRIALGGKPRVISPDVAGLEVQARVPSPTFDWVVGDGAAVARRDVVDTTLCLKCHVGSMYQHGGDRVDNVDYCLICHNAASNEQSVRVPMGVDASEAYDGKVGETFEMKTMLHRIHSANWDWNPARGVEEYNPPYLVYRNRGVYAFAGEGELPPNWESGEDCVHSSGRTGRRVFGADLANDNSCQPHNFHAPTYPRSLNECTACHKDTFTVIPDQAVAMASTVDVGDTVDYTNQTDDVLQGAATTACVTCHYNAATRGHAYQNSWNPQDFPEGRQTIIDAGN